MTSTPASTELFEFSLLRGDVARRLGWSSLNVALTKAKGLITLPAALAILGAQGYGTVTVVLSTSAMLVPIVVLNVPDGAGRLVVGAPSAAAAHWRVHRVRAFGARAAIACVALGAILGAVTGSTIVFWTGALTAASVAFKVAAVHLEYFQRTALLVRVQLAAEYGAVITGLLVATWFGPDGMLAANTVAVTLCAAWAATTFRPGTQPADTSGPFWGPALRIALPLLPVAFMQWMLFSVDALLIYRILGQGATGAYSAAYSMASVALLLPIALNAVWYATAQRMLERSRRTVMRYALALVGGITVAGATLVLLALATGNLISEYWLTQPVYEAVPVCLPWLVGAFATFGVAKVAEGVVYAGGMVWAIFVANVLAASANFALNLLWIPRMGIEGAAVATACGYAILAVLLWVAAAAVLRKPRP